MQFLHASTCVQAVSLGYWWLQAPVVAMAGVYYLQAGMLQDAAERACRDLFRRFFRTGG